MYLQKLDLEKRHLFLDLEIYMSKTDGEFSDEERQIIDAHCIEMHIDNNNYECELPVDEIFYRLRKDCTRTEKRIVFLEICAVVMADNIYDDKEEVIIKHLSEILEIEKEDVDMTFKIINDLKKAYEACAKYIGGE